MTIYTPTELIEQVQNRIKEGYYKPDQTLVVTIWVADDARSPPFGWRPGQENDPDRVSEEKWTKFVSSISRGLYEGQLESAQATLLDEWLREWEDENEDEGENEE